MNAAARRLDRAPGDNGGARPDRETVRVPCPKCGSPESALVFKGRDWLHEIPGDYFVSACARCGFWFQNPRPSRARAADLYPSDYAPYAEPEESSAPGPAPDAAPRAPGAGASGCRAPSRAARRVSLRALEPRFVDGGRLLEIGCASGARLLELRRSGWESLHGIELGPQAAETARRNGFDVVCADVDAALEAFPDAGFDVVIASMVIEHFADPFATVRRLARTIKPGGEFLFSTIDRGSLDAWIYRRYWRNLDLPRHMSWFRTSDLRDMLAPDFEAVEMVHQAEPIDFVGSARFRASEQNRILDRLVLALGEGRLFTAARVLARLGLTSRVSVRCRRRGGAA